MKAVELCSGAGGLALGVSQAGFTHDALIEIDSNACETIRENQRRCHPIAAAWPLREEDLRETAYSELSGGSDLLSAGVPCQPFSRAGKGRAQRDKRDMFSEVVRAARELQPRAILIENVKGLIRSSFSEYFAYLLLALGSPAFERGRDESWRQHLRCLRRHGRRDGMRYDVYVHTVNAADYGIPQWRERVFIFAFRHDLGIQWMPPQPTHSLDALLWFQYETGEYWRRHGLRRSRPGRMTRRIEDRLRALRKRVWSQPERLPWLTVRDALVGLPKLRQGQTAPDDPNHFLNRGARAYPNHSGSLIDEPAKALKAGSHGVPGGENALVLGGDRVRYFSVRECARLQTFPDDYVFSGPWIRAMQQVGNAVPVALACVMAMTVRQHLENVATRRAGNVTPFRERPYDRGGRETQPQLKRKVGA